jgi:hypothetical protein
MTDDDAQTYEKLFREVSNLTAEFIPYPSNITVADAVRLMRDEIYRWRSVNNMAITTPNKERL